MGRKRTEPMMPRIQIADWQTFTSACMCVSFWHLNACVCEQKQLKCGKRRSKWSKCTKCVCQKHCGNTALQVSVCECVCVWVFGNNSNSVLRCVVVCVCGLWTKLTKPDHQTTNNQKPTLPTWTMLSQRPRPWPRPCPLLPFACWGCCVYVAHQPQSKGFAAKLLKLSWDLKLREKTHWC